MIVTKKHLPRRTFLRGALGAVVAMPFLDAMVPALTAQAKRPLRFGAIYVPNGIYPQQWHPETTGSAFEFKPIMQPLEPYRSHLVTISGMKAPDGNPDMGGVHMGASAAWLNGIGPDTDQANYRWAPRTWALPPAPATATPASSSTRSPGATIRARSRWP
jgi:hypothetical protein